MSNTPTGYGMLFPVMTRYSSPGLRFLASSIDFSETSTPQIRANLPASAACKAPRSGRWIKPFGGGELLDDACLSFDKKIILQTGEIYRSLDNLLVVGPVLIKCLHDALGR
jgi:hypothetical protein